MDAVWGGGSNVHIVDLLRFLSVTFWTIVQSVRPLQDRPEGELGRLVKFLVLVCGVWPVCETLFEQLGLPVFTLILGIEAVEGHQVVPQPVQPALSNEENNKSCGQAQADDETQWDEDIGQARRIPAPASCLQHRGLMAGEICSSAGRSLRAVDTARREQHDGTALLCGS